MLDALRRHWPDPYGVQGGPGVSDFYFASKDWEFPMGHISFVGKLDGVALSAGAPPLTPGFTLDLMAKHSLDFWLTSEDLPDSDNRVTLDKQGNIVLSGAGLPGGQGRGEMAPQGQALPRDRPYGHRRERHGREPQVPSGPARLGGGGGE